MAAINRAALVALAAAKLPGGSRATAQDMKDVLNAVVESVCNILDDKDANDGYAGLDANGHLKPTSIASNRFQTNGDGVTTDFVIAHGLGYNPTCVQITARNAVSAASCWVQSTDAANVIIRFAVAPVVGVNNVFFHWLAI